jgi:hypothetical protein
MLKQLAIIWIMLAGLITHIHAQEATHPKPDTQASHHPTPAVSPAVVEQDNAPTLQPDSTKKQPGSEGKPFWIAFPPRDKYDWIAYGANLLLVGVGIAGVIVGTCTVLFIKAQVIEMRRQRIVMQRSLNAMIRQSKLIEKQLEVENKTLVLQYRPRITVRDVRAKSFTKETSGGGIGISKPVRCAMSLQIVNTGGSPAHIVEGDIYLISARRGHDAEEAEAEVKESTHMGIGERTLQPGQWEIIEFGLDTGIPNDVRWTELYKGASSHSIVLLGTIWYRDELGIPRKTGLHREYQPKSRIFVRRKDSEEEYSD